MTFLKNLTVTAKLAVHDNGKSIKDANGVPKQVKIPREKGERNPAFVRKHKLTPLSHPSD
jgi:hypothetical protein